VLARAAPQRTDRPPATRPGAAHRAHPAAGPAAILALQRTAGNRAVGRMLRRERLLQRDTFDDLKGSGESVVQDLCKELNTAGSGAPSPCAKNPGCPTGFCAPLPSKAEAIGIRNLIKQPLLAGIRVKVNPRVVSFWDDFMGSGFGVGGDASVRDLTASFGGDFA
jgi:hypothetical protein